MACESDNGGAGTDDPHQGCATDCERRLWPRIIVGILRDAEQFVVAAELDRTGTFDAKRGRCPLELDSTRFVCSFALFSGTEDTSARIMVRTTAGQLVSETTLSLGAFNYCGRDIAYVEFTPESDAGGWSDVRHITPCGMPR